MTDLERAAAAYREAADYFGEAQARHAAATEDYRQATAAMDAAQRVYLTAQQNLLFAARGETTEGNPAT